MMKISMTIKGIDRATERFGIQTVRKALRRTLQDMGNKARTQIDKTVRGEYNLKKKDLKGLLKVERVKPGALQVTVTAEGKKIPLLWFSAKQKDEGVQVKITKDKGAVIIPRSFITTMEYSEQVYWRIRKGGKLVPRGPVEALYGPSVPDLVRTQKVFSAVVKMVKEKAQSVFDHHIDYYMKKLGKGESEDSRA